MSGGDLNYVYRKVDEAAVEIYRRANKALHVAFAEHLELVAKALHELEWVFSGDSSSPAEEEAIRAVLSPTALSNIEQAIRTATKK